MLHIISHTLVDSAHIIPFLFAAYLFMEFIEHKAGDKAAAMINKAGKFGPVAGAALGIVPQCGFSAVMSNFYAGGIITKGTLIAVFLSTSDEMLPILISKNVSGDIILKILAVKVISALIIGLAIDAVIRKKGISRSSNISELCDDSHCHCEDGVLKSALHHTLTITLFIVIVTFVMNVAVEYIGEDRLSSFILNKPVVGESLAGIIGLIPNCASSVVLTELFLQGYLSAGAMISGLCVGSGVGLLVLFRVNKDIKDNLKTLAMLYITGVAVGLITGLLPIF